MLNKIGLTVGAVALLVYAALALTGVELGDTKREVLPPDVRQSPGGYRSFHFWHSGYSGGK